MDMDFENQFGLNRNQTAALPLDDDQQLDLELQKAKEDLENRLKEINFSILIAKSVTLLGVATAIFFTGSYLYRSFVPQIAGGIEKLLTSVLG